MTAARLHLRYRFSCAVLGSVREDTHTVHLLYAAGSVGGFSCTAVTAACTAAAGRLHCSSTMALLLWPIWNLLVATMCCLISYGGAAVCELQWQDQ